jgi:hypothetical protein
MLINETKRQHFAERLDGHGRGHTERGGHGAGGGSDERGGHAAHLCGSDAGHPAARERGGRRLCHGHSGQACGSAPSLKLKKEKKEPSREVGIS